jgi:hypothetical protein
MRGAAHTGSPRSIAPARPWPSATRERVQALRARTDPADLAHGPVAEDGRVN